MAFNAYTTPNFYQDNDNESGYLNDIVSCGVLAVGEQVYVAAPSAPIYRIVEIGDMCMMEEITFPARH